MCSSPRQWVIPRRSNDAGQDITYTFNWDNKLRKAEWPGNNSIELKYDPLGNRVYKKSTASGSATERKYIVDITGELPVILMEIDPASGNIMRTYIYANSEILAQHDGDTSADRYFYLHDRLGSVRLVIDDEGGVQDYYTYEPFGQTIESGGTLENPFRFTGQYYDQEIEEYYLRARQYNPQIARFTSRDPIRGEFTEPQTLHLYLYCINDPINRVDLTGNRPVWAMYEFWAEIGGEVVKGAAATLDGVNPIPFWNPFEHVYANEDGTVDRIYLESRMWGSVARTSASFALNAWAVRSMLAAAPGGSVTATFAERLLVGAFWPGVIAGEAGSAVSLTWGTSSALLGVAGIADNFFDFLDLLE